MKGKPVSIEGIQKSYLFGLKTVFKNEYLKIWSQTPFFFFLFFFFGLYQCLYCNMWLCEVWKQRQVYLAFVQTPLPYNGIVVEFFFFFHSALWVVLYILLLRCQQTLFPNSLSNHSRTGEQHDKSESRVLLVQGMDKFFLKSFTLFQPRNMRV